MPAWLDMSADGFEAAFEALLTSKREASTDIDATVAAILDDVRKRGDEALADYSLRFDRVVSFKCRNVDCGDNGQVDGIEVKDTQLKNSTSDSCLSPEGPTNSVPSGSLPVASISLSPSFLRH